MLHIRQAAKADLPVVRDLFWQYLQWANEQVNQVFDINFDIATMLEHDMDDIGKFWPPNGRLLLASDETGVVVGCACMRTIKPHVAELKRMYVRPNYRRNGIGRVLVQTLIAELHKSDYKVLRLDSARFMHEAHALYQSLGFQEIEQYAESEIPEDFRQHWVFMERSL